MQNWVARHFAPGADIRLLRRLGKKIVYTNNGCLDGVTQTSFAGWGDAPVCADCPWRERPDVCSDERNAAFGEFRNEVADFQALLGGNRADYNLDPTASRGARGLLPRPGGLEPQAQDPIDIGCRSPSGRSRSTTRSATSIPAARRARTGI